MYGIETVDDSIRDYMSKNELSNEPYIFHFPDGNATIARLLVRKTYSQFNTWEHYGRYCHC